MGKRAVVVLLAVVLAAGTAFAAGVPNKTVTIKPSGPSEGAAKAAADEPAPVKAAPEAAPAAAEPAPEPGAIPPGYEAAAKRLGLARLAAYRVQGSRVAVTEDGCYLLLTDDYAKVDGQKGPPLLAVMVGRDGAVKRVVLMRSPDDPACVRLVVPQLGVLEKQTVTTGEEARPVLAIAGAFETSAGVQKTVNGTLELFKPVFRKLEQKDGALNFDGVALTPEAFQAPAEAKQNAGVPPA